MCCKTFLIYYIIKIVDEKQVGLKTGLQRVVVDEITIIMFKLNGSLRFWMKHSSP